MRCAPIIQYQIVVLIIVDRRMRGIVNLRADLLRRAGLQEFSLERTYVRGECGVAIVRALAIAEARRLDEAVRREINRGVGGQCGARVAFKDLESGEDDRAGARSDGREDPILVAVCDILPTVSL